MEIRARFGKRRPPLPCTRLRSQRAKPLFFGVVCLCNRGIQLMTARGVIPLEFIINLGGCAECFFQIVCAHQRRGAVNFVHFLHFFGNIHIARFTVHFLMRQFLAEYRVQIFFGGRLSRGRVQHRVGLFLHIRAKVVPLLRHLVFGQI